MGRPKGPIGRAAEALGIDPQSVRRAVGQAGHDVKAVSFETAHQLAAAIVDKSKSLDHAANGRGEGTHEARSDLAAAKARLAEAAARKAAIQAAQLAGELVDRAAVRDVGIRIIAEARAALLASSHRIADLVAGLTDRARIADIVEAEIRTALGVCADEERFWDALDREALS